MPGQDGAQNPDNIELNRLPLYGYYFTDLRWQEGSIDFIKSSLLFFDGIALALPSSMARQMIQSDPVLAWPLYEKGLLRNLNPEDWATDASAEEILWSVVDALEEEKEHLRRRGNWWMATSQVGPRRLGGGCAAGDLLGDELRRRGLLDGDLVDGLVEMDCTTRFFILMAVARSLCRAAPSFGIELAPFTDEVHWRSLRLFGNRAAVGHTVMTDLLEVGVDLSSVPLEDVLSFRAEQGQHYRAYMRGVRRFLLDMSALDAIEMKKQYYIRREELLDAGADLRRHARRNLKQAGPPLFVAGVSAIWTGAMGDVIGAMLAALLAALALPNQAPAASSFTYLFAIRDKLR